MSNTPRNLTRNQLAEFLPNARAVRAFEQMLKSVGELFPSDVITLNRLIQEAYIEAAGGTAKAQQALDLFNSYSQDGDINASAADAKATAALDMLASIADSLATIASAPIQREDPSLSTDYLDFSMNPRYSASPGRVHWGSTGTLEIEMGGGNITQQVGEEFFTYGKATASITEGQLIMVTGAVGASGVVTFAPTTTGLLDPNAILGIATENIALNGFGRVTMLGVVHGINTTGSSVGEVWVDGDVLWYNTAFVGSMTKVKPVAPNMKTQVAIVINAGSGSSGSLQVEIVNGSTLGGTDTNVQMTALADKQLLQYDAAAGYWKNIAVALISEPPITAGTTAQYWRGDKSWQTLNSAAVGLGNVTNNAQVKKAASSTNAAIPTWGGTTGDALNAGGLVAPSGAIVGTTDAQALSGKIAIYLSRGQVSATGGSTTTLVTLSNVAANQTFLITVRQSGGTSNMVICMVTAYGAAAKSLRVAQDNTVLVLDMNVTASGLALQLVIGSGFGLTTWDWVLTELG